MENSLLETTELWAAVNSLTFNKDFGYFNKAMIVHLVLFFWQFVILKQFIVWLIRCWVLRSACKLLNYKSWCLVEWFTGKFCLYAPTCKQLQSSCYIYAEQQQQQQFGVLGTPQVLQLKNKLKLHFSRKAPHFGCWISESHHLFHIFSLQFNLFFSVFWVCISEKWSFLFIKYIFCLSL